MIKEQLYQSRQWEPYEFIGQLCIALSETRHTHSLDRFTVVTESCTRWEKIKLRKKKKKITDAHAFALTKPFCYLSKLFFLKR